MPHVVASVLWRRLDTGGHDACRLLRVGDGWRLEGCAVFDQEGKPCRLDYRVGCDGAWHTREATVSGFAGDETLALEIERHADGAWFLNGTEQPAARGCIDIDLAFTPATNLLFIRRAALAVGASAPAPAAWLAFPEARLDRLEQTYERVAEGTYAYEAPVFGYAERLTVSSDDFVTDYPGLWTTQADSVS